MAETSGVNQNYKEFPYKRPVDFNENRLFWTYEYKGDRVLMRKSPPGKGGKIQGGRG
jgi:hypothetical protein